MSENLLPPLDSFDLERLDESIRQHGVREPIVEDEFGKPIDGYHRKAIAAKYGLDCPARVVTGLTEPEKYELAIMLNAARRHLTIEQKRHIWRQRRARIETVLMADPARSDRAIAEETGVDGKTVAKVREHMENNADIRILERRGRGEPVEKAENYADHRNETAFSLEIYYACESDEIRRRGDDPYLQKSDRLTWYSHRQILNTDAPRNVDAEEAMVLEIAARLRRELRARPMKTMLRDFIIA